LRLKKKFVFSKIENSSKQQAQIEKQSNTTKPVESKAEKAESQIPDPSFFSTALHIILHNSTRTNSQTSTTAVSFFPLNIAGE